MRKFSSVRSWRHFSPPQSLSPQAESTSSLDSESFSLIGWSLMGIGALCTAIGVFFYGRVLDCLTSLTTCSSGTGVTNLEVGLGFLVVGGPALFIGAIFAAAGHLTEHLSPVSEDEDVSEKVSTRRRLCMKCGHEISASAKFCEYCGNQLSEAKTGQS